jgi:conjugal transfer pilus assembly protein TrbC
VLARSVAGLAALALLTPALAQAPDSAKFPSPGDLDELVRTERARSDEVLRRLPVTPPGDPERGRAIPKVSVTPGRAPDPAAIAEQFRHEQTRESPGAPTLLVFVSHSMPPESLLRLAHQAKRADGVLVFRGLAGATLREMIERVEPLARTGAAIQIDPEAFGRFGVKAVPTFVLAEGSRSCADRSCDANARRIAGDVTLDFALERLARADDPLGAAAAARLTMLRGGAR